MTIEIKTMLLRRLYALYDQLVAPFPAVCGKGCDPCCTCNVTCTTLEALLMVRHLESCGRLAALGTRLAACPDGRFQPKITINHLAALCASGQDPPDEQAIPGAGACLCLDDGVCSLYDVRPFGCRAMTSTHRCRRDGQATMPPFILSLNHVMMQYIEALDRPGATGNMVDLLTFLSDGSHRRAYLDQRLQAFQAPLAANQAIRVLMVPPEHHQQMKPALEQIQALFRKAQSWTTV